VSLEKTLERQVVAALAFLGFTTIKVGFDGWPDRLVLLGNGRHIWFELKQKKGRLRPQQMVRIALLEKDGERVYIIRSEDEALEAVKDAVKFV
jgi:hypothetical protein